MRKALFVASTAFVGLFLQMFFARYLSLGDVAPHLLLLFVVAHGFLFGPVVGQLLGFFWGLVSDAMGLNLFGMNTMLLTWAGFLAGTLRRRVACERVTAQFAVAFVSTTFYALGSVMLYDAFEGVIRFSFATYVWALLFNMMFVTAIFWLTDAWINLWGIESEHV